MPLKGWKKSTKEPASRAVAEVDPSRGKRLFILNFKARARVEKYVLASSIAEAEALAFKQAQEGRDLGYVVTVKPGYANTVQLQELVSVSAVDDETVRRLKGIDKKALLTTGHQNMVAATKHLLRKL